MKKVGFVSLIASGMAAAVIGPAAPAGAGVDHHTWLDQTGLRVTVPQVDTAVHQSR